MDGWQAACARIPLWQSVAAALCHQGGVSTLTSAALLLSRGQGDGGLFVGPGATEAAAITQRRWTPLLWGGRLAKQLLKATRDLSAGRRGRGCGYRKLQTRLGRFLLRSRTQVRERLLER